VHQKQIIVWHQNGNAINVADKLLPWELRLLKARALMVVIILGKNWGGLLYT